MKRKERLAEYRGATPEQLALDLKELEKNLFHLRFQSATDRLETPSEIRKAKRDIARILTVMTAKQTAKKETVHG
jgi:large subunit ribosomal protein L29